MLLQQTAMISAPPERIYGFFEMMERNYTRWHPDHILYRWLDAGRLVEGSRVYFEERIHGQHIKRTVRFTRIEPNRLIEFVPDNAFIRFFLRRVTFRMEPEGAQTRFTQEVHIRIGPIGRRLNRKGFAAVERHMREEGENLKAIMEAAG